MQLNEAHAVHERGSDPQLSLVLEVLRERGAAARAHGRATVISHLHETSQILAAWSQPERVRLAGMAHNAYGTEAFEQALFEPTEREVVCELIGADAERLVHLFCALKRDVLVAALHAAGDRAVDSLPMVDRTRGTELVLTRREVGDVLVLSLANLAQQACHDDGSPAVWFSSVAPLARWAAQYAEVVPPIVDAWAATTREHEHSAIEAYDTALRLIATDPAAARMKLTSATQCLPHLAEASVWLAYLACGANDHDLASAHASRATRALEGLGSAWDKRLTLSQWRALIGHVGQLQPADATRALQQVTSSPADLYLAVVDAGTASQPAQASRFSKLPRRFRDYVARQASPHVAYPGHNMYPELTAKPWHDPASIPLAVALEQAAEAISAELGALQHEHFRDEAEQIERVGRWSVLFLAKRGVIPPLVWQLCPVTAAVLEAHREQTLLAGVTYVSCLDPGTHVAPHRGTTNTRLRCHLGLEVPDGCGITVGGIAGAWQPGRCSVFDDSFVHEVWNYSAARRTVLIVDLWHPELTAEEIALLQWMAGE
ncbi:MAG: aspartyl/asparaginyl beta-hydroxylase domain-containing protein [Polyangiales bacterium]